MPRNKAEDMLNFDLPSRANFSQSLQVSEVGERRVSELPGVLLQCGASKT